MNRIFVMIWVLMAINGHAQTFHINLDAESKKKISSYNSAQASIPSMKLYRIQFGVVSDRHEMETNLRNFKNTFNLEPDWHQTGPYFYMKAGYYSSKLASFKDYNEIRKRYSGAIYIVETVEKSKMKDISVSRF